MSEHTLWTTMVSFTIALLQSVIDRANHSNAFQTFKLFTFGKNSGKGGKCKMEQRAEKSCSGQVRILYKYKRQM